MRIAFYAPLKAPDHPVPSGDRTIARLLLAALERAGERRGWEVEVASRFRSFEGAGDPARQARLRALGARFAERLARRYERRPGAERPVLWFTYHLYHKAPDWLGPPVTARLGVPYVLAEASHAARQQRGAWRIGHEAAAAAIRGADAVLTINRDDAPGLRSIVDDPGRILALAPFLGPGGGSPDRTPQGSSGRSLPACDARAMAAGRLGIPPDEPWLLCVAMMRGGRKLASFASLAASLARLAALRWHLVLAGDGPARPAVEAAVASRLPAGRTTFTGRVDGEALGWLYEGSDLFVWPAVREPLGMAMLEAQGHGLPVVAARTRGVPDLVMDAQTGLLAPEGDPAAFADAVRTLLCSPGRRRRMGLAARARVIREHGFETAVDRIGALVETLLRDRAPKEKPGAPPAGRGRKPSLGAAPETGAA